MATIVTLCDNLITRLETISGLAGRVHYWDGLASEFLESTYVAPFVGIIPGSSVNLSQDSVMQSAVDERHTLEIILVARDPRGNGIMGREGVLLLGSIRDKLIAYQLHADASPLYYGGYRHDRDYEYMGATVWRFQAECQQVEQL